MTTRQPESGKIIVFSAASGAGKNTLINHAMSIVPNLVYSISATTRAPRPGEVNGVHYFFLTTNQFKKKIAANEFAEWAEVHNHFYGTPRSHIDATIAAGKHIVMDIDVWGKSKFDKVYPQAVGIFIVPPSLEELKRRLCARNTDNEETINIRLVNAQKEMKFAQAEGKYEYTLVNDNLERAQKEVVEIIRKIIGE